MHVPTHFGSFHVSKNVAVLGIRRSCETIFEIFALSLDFLIPASDDALELAELAAELAARGVSEVASAGCDLSGFWDFGVANFGALKRAISFFIFSLSA